MGKAIRREQVVIIPEDYWTSSLSNIKWIIKEKNAKKHKGNK